MVMDADIFAARPFSARDLFEVSPCEKGSAVCDLSQQHQLRAKNDCHRLYGDERDQNLEWCGFGPLSHFQQSQLEAPHACLTGLSRHFQALQGSRTTDLEHHMSCAGLSQRKSLLGSQCKSDHWHLLTMLSGSRVPAASVQIILFSLSKSCTAGSCCMSCS